MKRLLPNCPQTILQPEVTPCALNHKYIGEWKIRNWTKHYQEVGGQLQEWIFHPFGGPVQNVKGKGFLLNGTEVFKLFISFQVVQPQQNQQHHKEFSWCWLIKWKFSLWCWFSSKIQKILQTGRVTCFNSPQNITKKYGREVFLVRQLAFCLLEDLYEWLSYPLKITQYLLVGDWPIEESMWQCGSDLGHPLLCTGCACSRRNTTSG